MVNLICPVAYVDFRSTESLASLAEKLSAQLFGGINFIGENTGVWDEVPAVRLERCFLGLSVELGGQHGSYTLQIEMADFPWDLVSSEERATASVDLSATVIQLLKQVQLAEIIVE